MFKCVCGFVCAYVRCRERRRRVTANLLLCDWREMGDCLGKGRTIYALEFSSYATYRKQERQDRK